MDNNFSESKNLMIVFDEAYDGVIKLNAKGECLGFNRLAAEGLRRHGCIPEQMIAKTVWENFPKLKDTLLEQQLRELLEHEISLKHEFYYLADQRWYRIEGYASSPGALLIFRDITSEKKTAA
jgi:sensor histidine kinase regulating citrate/malate metabolism